MGLLIGLIWIIAGIAYVIYKFGSEELDGGAIGGVGCVIAVVVAFLALSGFAWLCLNVTDNDAEASLLAWGIILSVIAAVFIVRRIRISRRNNSEQSRDEEEGHDHHGL